MARLEIVLLGTGGPIANPARASSAAAVLLDGTPRILADAGGGAFERLGRAGLDPAELGAAVAAVRERYDGEVVVAEDLLRV